MHWKAYTLGLVCVVSVCVIGGQGVTVGAAQQGTPADGYAVVQERACYEIEPLGNGSQSVQEFYDYRSGQNTSFSSVGTRELQVSQGSQLFLYEGREGLSLVFLHDRLDDGRGGGAISVDIAGLPASGTWVVEDDDYGPQTDDRFRHGETTSAIDWMWAPNRTDGAAFRGLGGESFEITVEPAWSENAWAVTGRTPPFPYGDDELTRWFVRGAGGTDDLDKTAPVTIRSGGCDRSAPATTLSSTTSEAVVGENVTLDASGTTDDSSIVAYRWDVNGDGTVDRTTDEPTLTVAYDEPAIYRPTVIAEDQFRNNGTANVTVSVAEPTPLAAAIDAPTTVRVGSEQRFSATISAGDGEIERYRWDFGDGTNGTGETVTHAFESPGEFEVVLRVVDASGTAATNRTTVTAVDRTPPNATLSLPDRVGVGEQFALNASASTDDTGVTAYRWDLDGDGAIDRTTTAGLLRTTFRTAGERTVAVTVADAENNTARATGTVTVTDEPALTADISVAGPVRVGAEATFEASAASAGGTVDTYEWSFGDGTTATGQPIAHTYTAAGNYTVSLRVTDDAGNSATVNRTVPVATSPTNDAGSDDGGTASDEGRDPGSADQGENERSSDDGADGTDGSAENADSSREDTEGSTDGGGDDGVTDGGGDDESEPAGAGSDAADRSDRRNSNGGGGNGGGGGGSDGRSSFDRRIPNTQPITQQQPGMRLTYRQVGPDRFIATVRNATQGTTVARETPGDVGESGNDAELRAMAFTATADRPLYRLNVTVNGSSGVDAGTTRIDDELVAVYPEVQPASDIGANTFNLTYVFDVDRDLLRELDVSRSNILVATLENGEWRQREAVVSPSGSELVVNTTVGAPKPAVFGLQRANLTVTNVSTGTPSVVRGQSTLFTVRLRNDGHRDARERVRLRAGARTLLDRTVSVPARSRRNLTTRVRFTRAGERPLTVLDYERPLEVVPPRPDMVVTDVRLERETIRPGENATIHATVRNRGLAAGTAQLSVSAFGTVVDTKRVSLPAGGSQNVSYSQRIESAGTYELGINGTTRQVVVSGGSNGGGGTPPDAASEPVSSSGLFSNSVVAVLVGLALFLLVAVIVAATVWE